MAAATTGGVSDYRRPRRTSKRSRVANRGGIMAESDGYAVSLRHEPSLNKELSPDDPHVASGNLAHYSNEVSSVKKALVPLKLDPLPNLQIQV